MRSLQGSLPFLLLCFYFLPFFAFFAFWPATAFGFTLSVATVSISTLLLFLLLKKREETCSSNSSPSLHQKSPGLLTTPKPVAITASFFDIVKDSFRKSPAISLSHQKEIIDALVVEQESLKKSYTAQIHILEEERLSTQKTLEEKEFFVEEKARQLAEIGSAFSQKTEEVEALKTEVANLKFELFALCRIDEQIVSNKQSINDDMQPQQLDTTMTESQEK